MISVLIDDHKNLVYGAFNNGIILTFDIKGWILLSTSRYVEGELYDMKLSFNGNYLFLVEN